MGRTSTFPLVDRLIDGGARAFLAERRSAGVSYEQIARELATAHEVEVTTETVRRWCIAEEIEPTAEATS